MFVFVVYTLCGASALQSVELKRSIGDSAVQDSMLESTIRFVQTACDRTFKVLKSHYKRIGHMYDIDIWNQNMVQIILILIALLRTNYLMSNFNSLIQIENSHWMFNLD